MENKLFSENQGLVYSVFNDCFSDYRWLEDDLLQEGMFALLKASEVFVPDDTLASFSTFAYKCIKNSMLQLIKAELRIKTVSLNAKVSNDEDAKTYEETYGCEDSYDESILKDIILDCARNTRERLILQKRMDGKTQKEIAHDLGLSEVRISEILKSLKPLVLKRLK